MTYCIDFFRKFKKDGNFCGLDKSQVSRLTAYLEIVELLMKQKIPEEEIYTNFSVRAAEPLITAKDEARVEGLNYVTARLKDGKKIKTGDIQTNLKSCTCATTHAEPRLKKSCTCATPSPEQKPDPEPKTPLTTCEEIPPQPSLAAQMNGEKAPEPPVHRPPPCLGGGGCDQKPNRFITDKVRGAVCDAIGAPINQLPGNMCPYDAKLARKSEGAFVPASGDLSVLDAKIPAEAARPAYKITHRLSTPAEVSDHTQQFVDDLPEAAQENLHALLKADAGHLFDGDPRELIITLLDEKAETL